MIQYPTAFIHGTGPSIISITTDREHVACSLPFHSRPIGNANAGCQVGWAFPLPPGPPRDRVLESQCGMYLADFTVKYHCSVDLFFLSSLRFPPHFKKNLGQILSDG